MSYLEVLESLNDDSSGVYLITNKLNNKRYVGQSINLKKRLKKHLYLTEEERYNAPLYKAIKKYGIDNFTLEILYKTKDRDFRKVRIELDEKEKYYINKYKTYGQYNQTLGGDAGVLGYKFTEEQLERQKVTGRNISMDGRYMIYIFDLEERCYYTFVNATIAAEFLDLKGPSLRGSVRYKSPYLGRYYVAFSKEKLEEKIKNHSLTYTRRIVGYFRPKYKYRAYKKGVDSGYMNIGKLAEFFGSNKRNMYTLTHRILKGRSPIYKTYTIEITEL